MGASTCKSAAPTPKLLAFSTSLKDAWMIKALTLLVTKLPQKVSYEIHLKPALHLHCFSDNTECKTIGLLFPVYRLYFFK